MESQPLSLHQLLGQVKSSIRNNLPSPFWVVAEISELKVNYSGHCYLELIEKDPSGDTIKAKARATIWATAFRMIQPYFETVTGTRLATGMKVMVRVSAEFHELYGFSLNIIDIEPSFTIGELARQKQEIINRLKAEGVFDMNRSRAMPELPKTIAVVSSRTAAGYGDFMKQLSGNPFGYQFHVKLFPAVMQGDEAEQSVIAALDRIFEAEDLFDAVVIIRGGGSQAELNCFNNYWIALHVCQFPLPVLTGIGHEQDETITDLVAHTRLKTPTAVAEYLISLFRVADERLAGLSSAITGNAQSLVDQWNHNLEKYLLTLKPGAGKYLGKNTGDLRTLGIRMGAAAQRLPAHRHATVARLGDRLREVILMRLQQAKHRIEMLDKQNSYQDPFLLLKRGYSVTYYNGKVLKDPSAVPPETDITTRLAGGILRSRTQ